MSFHYPPYHNPPAIHAAKQAATSKTITTSDSSQNTPSIILNLMTFNIWRGGDEVNLSMVKDAILKANADIIAIQESDSNLIRLAELLGWSHINTRTQILSKYPLFDPENSGLGIAVKGEGSFSFPYTYVEVLPGRIIAIANVHLISESDGAEAVRDGMSADEVIANEKKLRVSQLQPVFQALSGLEEKGIPVFLMGDFNSPSHQDWTIQAAKIRKQVKFPLEWPESKALTELGFSDSYREVYPDPVANPGFTWTAGYPFPRIGSNETINRIDYIWRKGRSETLNSFIVGEAGIHMFNGEHINKDVKYTVTPWPSDHRAVVSNFRIKPALAPLMMTINKRLVTSGEILRLQFILNREDLTLAVLPANETTQKEFIFSKYLGKDFDRTTFVLGTQKLIPGAYKAILVDSNNRELNKVPFWVIAKGELPALTVSQKSFKEKEPITVRWKNAPGNKWDWIAIYKAGQSDVENYLTYLYINASIEGELVFDDQVLENPLEKGEYELRLLSNDSFIELANTTFSVK
jgi:endonuclease/exonuclease/phosphatase family metal-dependent hydrolase